MLLAVLGVLVAVNPAGLLRLELPALHPALQALVNPLVLVAIAMLVMRASVDFARLLGLDPAALHALAQPLVDLLMAHSVLMLVMLLAVNAPRLLRREISLLDGIPEALVQDLMRAASVAFPVVFVRSCGPGTEQQAECRSRSQDPSSTPSHFYPPWPAGGHRPLEPPRWRRVAE